MFIKKLLTIAAICFSIGGMGYYAVTHAMMEGNQEAMMHEHAHEHAHSHGHQPMSLKNHHLHGHSHK